MKVELRQSRFNLTLSSDTGRVRFSWPQTYTVGQATEEVKEELQVTAVTVTDLGNVPYSQKVQW